MGYFLQGDGVHVGVRRAVFVRGDEHRRPREAGRGKGGLVHRRGSIREAS